MYIDILGGFHSVPSMSAINGSKNIAIKKPESA